MKRYIFLCLAAVITASCNDDATGPDDPKLESELTFLRFQSAASITTRTGSFWAVRGRNTELELRYADGSDFLEFEVDATSLLRSPSGQTYQDGDSVLITVTVDPTDRAIVDFQPSGLVFNPTRPARLEINYQQCDDDIDADGDRDIHDDQLEQRLRIWKQELPGAPWFPQSSLRIDADEIEADIFGFTGFAMASS
jgi:hypothetical protein